MSPRLRGMKREERKKELSALHLSGRAIDGLSRLNVQTIGELIERAHDGIKGLRRFGKVTQVEISETLKALSRGLDKNGNVGWIRYAEERGFAIFPQDESPSWNARDLVAELPSVLQAVIEMKHGERGVMLLREHTLRPPHKDGTLQEISSVWGQTKQAASLLEKTIIELLRRVLLNDDYRGCCFRIRGEFLAPLRILRAAVESRENRQIAAAEWEALLEKTWGLRRSQVTALEGLLLKLMAIQLFAGRVASAESLSLPAGTLSPAGQRAVALIERALSLHYPDGLLRKHLNRLIQNRFGTHCGVPKLSSLLAGVTGLENSSGEGPFRMKLAFLLRTTDQCERLLREGGKPMHHRELASEITRVAQNKSRGLKSIRASLANDPRFKPIGRTGTWALSTWRLETRSVAAIAAELLEKSKVPMTEEKLFRLISKKRPVTSIGPHLSGDPRFQRVGPRKWMATGVCRIETT